MTIETVLKDWQIEEIYSNNEPNWTDFARAIEQAVLQSDDIQVLRKDIADYVHIATELATEIEALRKDAARYQWLRSAGIESELVVEDMYESVLSGEDLDAAIDAAREKQP